MLFMSTLYQFSWKISKKFVWLGGQWIVPTTIGLEFGKISKNTF